MASYPNAFGSNSIMSPEEQQVVHECMQDFSELQNVRSTFAAHWEEVAQIVLPHFRNTFMYGAWNTPGEKKTDKQVDATGMMALQRFGAIMDSLSTPRNQIWHLLGDEDDYVMKDRATRLWYESATKALFAHRYAPTANFASQNQLVFQQIGAFGTGPMFVDAVEPKYGRGFRYRCLPLGEWYLKENHQGIINGGIRWFRLTAEQTQSMWPIGEYGPLPETIRNALETKSQTQFDFLHRIVERVSYDKERLDAKGKQWASYYICIQAQCLMQPEGGYRTFPVPTSRYDQAPGESYGRGPAMFVLPSLKTLNAQKVTQLTVGHRAAAPVYLTSDDGLVDFSFRPLALNKGGISPEGRPLVQPLLPGDPRITQEMMDQEKQLIADAFLVSLFQILTETPQMSATEVIERVNEKGILVAPTAGRQQSDYLGPLIHRELDMAADMNLLPPLPPRLAEAARARGGIAYKVKYTSPLARAAQAQEAAGFYRTVEGVKELVNITQDASLLDVFNFDKASRGIAMIQGVNESWLADDEEMKAKREQRKEAEQQRMQIQAAPAAAALMKAKAVAAKAGQPVAGQEGQQQ